MESFAAIGRTPIEFRVGTEENDFIDNANLAELAMIFSDGAGTWADVNPAWPVELILRSILGRDEVEIYNTASAGMVMGILILLLVTSMSEDALNAVPCSLREAAYGLGATRLEVAIKVVVPAALSGIGAAIVVALSRAIGETMIVAISAGAGPVFTFNPFKAAETMTGHIVRISGGDLSYDSIDYNSLFAIGLMLFSITLVLNVISQWLIRRFREVYE